jgi:LacI family gluconate utilization system Gnt-I transcriptional repressor
MLIEAGIPVVEIWDVSSRPLDMVIGFDHARVGADVAAYFLAKGHKRFASLTAGDSRALARAAGFRAAVLAGGGAMTAERVVGTPSTIAAGREGVKALLPELGEGCALLCSSDFLAFGAVTEARVQGIAVPGRLSVCGFGDFELSAMSEPSITSVSLEGPGTGRSAAAFLLRRLAGGAPREGERVQVAYQIIERASG